MLGMSGIARVLAAGVATASSSFLDGALLCLRGEQVREERVVLRGTLC